MMITVFVATKRIRFLPAFGDPLRLSSYDLFHSLGARRENGEKGEVV